MNFDKSSAIVSVGIPLEFETIDHGVAEFSLYKSTVGESTCKMLQSGNDPCMGYPQKFTIVVEAVQKFFDTLVHIVETFTIREPKASQVMNPCRHFFFGNGGKLLSFPCPEIDFLERIFFFWGKSSCFRDFFG